MHTNKKGHWDMLIWIDGTYGVGKSTTVNILSELLPKSSVLNSDEYFSEMMINKKISIGGGLMPQNKKSFLLLFQKIIQEKINTQDFIIIDMALTQNECKEILFEHFLFTPHLHFILTAKTTMLLQRINSCSGRNTFFAQEWKDINELFLAENYRDAFVIDTTPLSPYETAIKIYQIICSQGDG